MTINNGRFQYNAKALFAGHGLRKVLLFASFNGLFMVHHQPRMDGSSGDGSTGRGSVRSKIVIQDKSHSHPLIAWLNVVIP